MTHFMWLCDIYRKEKEISHDVAGIRKERPVESITAFPS